jgi:glycosyltransferase involved in cell wall biosynthesis
MNVIDMSKTQVVIIANDWAIGGSNRYCLELVAALKDHQATDFAVTFLALASRRPEPRMTWLWQEAKALGLSIEMVPMNSQFDVGVIARLRRRLPMDRSVIVHTQEYRSNVIGRLLKLTRPGVIQVSTKHGFVLDTDWRTRLYVALDRLTLGLSDHYIAVCEATAQRLGNDWKLPARKVSTIYNGIATTRSVGGASTPALVIDQDQSFCIGFVGRLITNKGVGDLIEALRRAVAHEPRLRLIIAGDGPQRAEFESQAQGLPVTFLGVINTPERLYLSLHALVLCSHSSSSEAFPFVVLEAMRARVPVVATRVGGVAELIDDGQTGLLIPEAQPEMLSAALLKLAHDPKLCARLTTAAERQLQQRFSAKGMACQTAELYQRLLDERATSRTERQR